MAVTDYDKQNLTAAQQAGIAAATQAWNEANARGDTAGMERAHAAAENIRNSAGYTSDSSGAYSGGLGSQTSYAAGSSGYDTSDSVSGITNSGGSAYSQTGRNITGYQVNDWAQDNMDYSARAANAQGIEELNTWLSKRALKAEAQGIDISGNTPGILSNSQIKQQWYDTYGNYIDRSGRVSLTPTGSNYTYTPTGTTAGSAAGGGASAAASGTAAGGSSGTRASGSSGGTQNSGASVGGTAGGSQNGNLSGAYTAVLAQIQSQLSDQQTAYQDQLAQQQAAYQEQLARQQAQAEALTAELKAQYAAQQSAYAQALAAQQAAREAAVQKAVNTLEGQKTSTDAQYADLFRQLYVDRMKNQKNLNQQLAAGGVTGGAAESTRLGYDTAYEDALRQSEQSRIGAINDLDRAITDARLTGDIASAEAAASAVKEQVDAYVDALKYLIERQDALNAQQAAYHHEDMAAARKYAYETAAENRKYAYETAAEDRSYAYKTAAENRSYAYKTAMQLINAGAMPGEDLLLTAGIDTAAARAMVAAVQAERVAEAERIARQEQAAAAQAAEKAAAEAEKAALSAAKPTLTAAQVNAAIKNGVRTDAVLAAYEYYYGQPYRG